MKNVKGILQSMLQIHPAEAAKISANDRCYGLHYQPKEPAALKNNPATQSKAVRASVCTAFHYPPLWKNSNRSYLSAPYHFTLVSRFPAHIPQTP